MGFHSNDTLDTTIKALPQNAFGAAKVAQRQGLINTGTIDITTDKATRIITVKDYGTGIPAEMVRNALLTSGASHKSDLHLHIRSGRVLY